jgi:hypothetical protein
MPNQSSNPSDHREEERLKLAMLKRLTTDAFQAIDRGKHLTVTIKNLDRFLDSADGKAPAAGRR